MYCLSFILCMICITLLRTNKSVLSMFREVLQLWYIICYIGFCISKCHTWNYEVWWKIHCINHLLLPCYIFVYTVAVVILQCGANIPSCFAMGWPIQTVYGFYIYNHTGSRMSNCISFTVKILWYVELVKLLVVEAWLAEQI